MANIRIPTYERQVEAPQQRASQAKAPEPLRQAYGENVAQATGNLGKAMMQLGDDFVRIQANTDKNKLLIAESTIKNAYKAKQLELMKANSVEEYEQMSNDFLENIQQQTKDYLGERVNNLFASQLQPMYEGMALELQMNKIGIAQKVNLQDLNKLVDTGTNNVVFAPDGLDIDAERQNVLIAIETSPQNQEVKDKLTTTANKRFDEAEIYRKAELEPKTIINDIKDPSKYTNLNPEEKLALIPKIEKIINTNEQTALYTSATEKFTDQITGKTDYTQAIKYVKEQKDYAPKNRNAVINMLNGEFSKELSLTKKEYDAEKQRLLGNLYETILNNGDVSGAIQSINNSDVLLPTDKKAIIDRATKTIDNTNKTDNPYTKTSLIDKIANGTATENEILTANLKGEITNHTMTVMSKMLKLAQTPNQQILKNALQQVTKSYSNGIVGTTPAEARGMANSKLQVMNIYNDAIANGKSTQEIQDLLAPEKVQRITEINRPTLEENTQEIQKQITKKNSGDVLNLDIEIEEEDNGGDILGLGI